MFRASSFSFFFFNSSRLLQTVGVVKSWNPRGYGFITALSDQSSSIFVHHDDCRFADQGEGLFRSLRPGTRVIFDKVLDTRLSASRRAPNSEASKTRAINVRTIHGDGFGDGPSLTATGPTRSTPYTSTPACHALIGIKSLAGIVLTWDEGTGCGFIEVSNTAEACHIFCHRSAIVPSSSSSSFSSSSSSSSLSPNSLLFRQHHLSSSSSSRLLPGRKSAHFRATPAMMALMKSGQAAANQTLRVGDKVVFDVVQDIRSGVNRGKPIAQNVRVEIVP